MARSRLSTKQASIIICSNPGTRPKKISIQRWTNCSRIGRRHSRHSLREFACWETVGHLFHTTSKISWRAITFRIRCSISKQPVRFRSPQSVELLDEEETHNLPVVILPTGVRLKQPSLAELAEHAGLQNSRYRSILRSGYRRWWSSGLAAAVWRQRRFTHSHDRA